MEFDRLLLWCGMEQPRVTKLAKVSTQPVRVWGLDDVMATPSERVLYELGTLTGQQKYDLLLELLRSTEVSAYIKGH